MGGDRDSDDEKRKKRKRRKEKEPDSKRRHLNEPEQEEIQTTGDISLSVSDSNKLRAQLGLPLLDADPVSESTTNPEDADVWKPAKNVGEELKTKKLREKLESAKEKRKIQKKLDNIKKIADYELEDTSSWVEKMRNQEVEKRLASERAAILDKMDEEFGISSLVNEEFGDTKSDKLSYDSGELKGMKIEHSAKKFQSGQSFVLTLKDSNILDEEEKGAEKDVLVNVNMIDNELAEENVKNKKLRLDYNPYEDDYDEYGLPKTTEVLSKYKEVIGGAEKKFMLVGRAGSVVDEESRIKQEMKKQFDSNKISLEGIKPVIASDYYIPGEAKFKSSKRKVKVRKRVKVTADDLLPLPHENINSSSSINKTEPMTNSENEEKSKTISVKEENDPLVESALERSRRLLNSGKQKSDIAKSIAEKLHSSSKVEVKMEPSLGKVDLKDLVLDDTSEFCRSLGKIPSIKNPPDTKPRAFKLDPDLEELYMRDGGDAVDSDDDDDDFKAERNISWDTSKSGKHNSSLHILGDEPQVSAGLSSALLLAQKKGYIEHDDSLNSGGIVRQLKSKIAPTYAIEDKMAKHYDDKWSKKEERDRTVLREFRDMSCYNPDVKIEYCDDSGRAINEKEAFRQLSHRFHGKGSGKIKTEKRQKKLAELAKLKSMSSTDTPLHTSQIMQLKQKQLQTPYLVLSGVGKTLTGATLEKK